MDADVHFFLEDFRKLNKNITLSRAHLICVLPNSLRNELYTLPKPFREICWRVGFSAKKKNNIIHHVEKNKINWDLHLWFMYFIC